jgi:hypothetical protein
MQMDTDLFPIRCPNCAIGQLRRGLYDFSGDIFTTVI